MFESLDKIMAELEFMIDKVEKLKSDNHTEQDRRLAILKTELEKVLAFSLYILVNEDE